MALAELSQLQVLLSKADGPDVIFPCILAEGDKAAQSQALEREYLRLTHIADPERFRGDPQAQSTARWVLTRLFEFHHEAVLAIGASGDEASDDGLTSGHFAGLPAEALFTVTTAKGVYQAEALLAEGDLSTVYRGRKLLVTPDETGAGRGVAIKVADDSSNNDLLQNEVHSLRFLNRAATPQRKHLPVLVDEFRTSDGRFGTVLRLIKGHSFSVIHKQYTQGVDGQHAAWILKRLLSVLAHAHSQGVIHGNIKPEHIIVQPQNHNVVLLDWSHSIRTAQPAVLSIPGILSDYSAPEIREEQSPTAASDIYSVGKCMIMLLGGDLHYDSIPSHIDKRLTCFLQTFVWPNPQERAQNAEQLHEKLVQLREEIYGPQQFLEFGM